MIALDMLGRRLRAGDYILRADNGNLCMGRITRLVNHPDGALVLIDNSLYIWSNNASKISGKLVVAHKLSE